MTSEGDVLETGPHRGAKVGKRVLEARPPRQYGNGWIWGITVFHEIEGKFPGVYDTRWHMYGLCDVAWSKRKAWKQFRAALENEAARD